MIDYDYNGRQYKIIPLDEMIDGLVYTGFCRNATFAYWDGREFLHIRHKFNATFIEKIPHPENEYHFDVFMVQDVAYPCEEVDQLMDLLRKEKYITK